MRRENPAGLNVIKGLIVNAKVTRSDIAAIIDNVRYNYPAIVGKDIIDYPRRLDIGTFRPSCTNWMYSVHAIDVCGEVVPVVSRFGKII